MQVFESFRTYRIGQTIATLMGGAILAGAIAACGQSNSVTDASPTPEPTEAVAQSLATVPPGRAETPGTSPVSPRKPETITTVAPTTPIAITTPTVVATDTPASATKPDEGDGDEVDAGRQLFTENGCLACHGADLSGGIGPALAGRTQEDLTEDRIRTQLANGGNGMPAFGHLEPDQVNTLIALIRSL
jgi:mono/diheme cytochrome c family protein